MKEETKKEVKEFAEKYVIAVLPEVSYYTVDVFEVEGKLKPFLGIYKSEESSLQKVTYVCTKCGDHLNEDDVINHILEKHVNRLDY